MRVDRLDANKNIIAGSTAVRTNESVASGIGQGLSTVGRSVEGLGDAALTVQAANIEKRQREEIALRRLQDVDDTAAATQALSGFKRAWTEKFQNHKQGATGDAANFTPTVLEDFGKQREEVLAGLSEGARAKLAPHLMDYETSTFENALGFETQKRKTHRVGVISDLVDTEAAGLRGDPAGLHKSLSTVINSIDGMSDGMNDDEVKEVKNKASNTLVTSAFQRRIEEDPAAARTELLSGKYDPFLSVSSKNTLINGADTEVKRQEAERRAAAREAEQRNREQFLINQVELRDKMQADLSSRSDTGVPVAGVDENAFKQAYGPKWQKPWENYKNQAQRADTIYHARSGLTDLSDQEILARIDQTKPVPGSANFNDEKAAHGIVVQTASQIITARRQDPVAFAVKNSPSVREAYKAMQEAPTDAGASANYVRALDAAQEKYGVPAANRRILGETEVKQIAADIDNLPADQRVQRISALEQLYGSNWQRVEKELRVQGDLKTDTQSILFLSNPNQKAVRLELTQALIEKDHLKGVVPSEDQKTIKDQLDASIADIRPTMVLEASGRIAPGATEQLDAIKNSVENVALRYASKGMPADKAVALAKKQIIDDAYNIQDGYRVPKYLQQRNGSINTSSPGFIREWGDNVLANIKADDLAVPDLDRRGIAKTDPRYKAEQSSIASTIRSTGRWVNNEDETGLYLVYGTTQQAARNHDGGRVEFSFIDGQDKGSALITSDLKYVGIPQ